MHAVRGERSSRALLFTMGDAWSSPRRAPAGAGGDGLPGASPTASGARLEPVERCSPRLRRAEQSFVAALRPRHPPARWRASSAPRPATHGLDRLPPHPPGAPAHGAGTPRLRRRAPAPRHRGLAAVGAFWGRARRAAGWPRAHLRLALRLRLCDADFRVGEGLLIAISDLAEYVFPQRCSASRG